MGWNHQLVMCLDTLEFFTVSAHRVFGWQPALSICHQMSTNKNLTGGWNLRAAVADAWKLWGGWVWGGGFANSCPSNNGSSTCTGSCNTCTGSGSTCTGRCSSGTATCSNACDWAKGRWAVSGLTKCSTQNIDLYIYICVCVCLYVYKNKCMWYIMWNQERGASWFSLQFFSM